MISPTLTLHSPVLRGVVRQEPINRWRTEYKRTSARDGGYFQASWTMLLDRGKTWEEQRALFMADGNLHLDEGARRGNASLLARWFETPYLMHHIEETAAGTVTWEGIIWSLELTLGGITRRVSMDEVYNAVRADYTDEAGNVQITDWFTEPESISLYGRKEMIVAERYVSAAQAEAAAQSFLAQHAWPEPKVTQVDSRQPAGLRVAAVGYGATANFQYVNTDAADGETGDISEFVTRILEYDCEFLLPGDIATNTLQRYRRFDRPIRCWDAIRELTHLGGAGGEPWLAQVWNGRRLNYVPADPAPGLYWHGQEKGVQGGAGTLNGWLIRPGVMRDMTSLATHARPGGFLQEARDFIVERVEMAEGSERPTFAPGADDPLAILRAQDQYLRWMEGERA